MKRRVLLLAIVAGLTLGATTTAHAEDEDNWPARYTATKKEILEYQGTLQNNWFKLKRATKVKVVFNRVNGGQRVERTLTLPKNTIIAGAKWDYDLPKKGYAVANGFDIPNVSYRLKAKLNVTGLYGNGELKYQLKPSQVTRIARPSYALPFGKGLLYRGGLAQMGSMTRAMDAVRITSDGYLESYPNRPQTYTDYEGRTGQFPYAYQPDGFAKIRRVLKKGASVYYYYNHHLKGVNDKKVRASGPYMYRLTLKNLHTPYMYQDFGYSEDLAIASVYRLGGVSYFTIMGVGFN